MKKPGHKPRLLGADLFWSHVNKTDGCWEWNAGKNPAGYGVFGENYKVFLAHRWSYANYHGSIPDGLFVLHHCDNRACVRPDHLYAGSKKDNARDMHSRGRARNNKGEAHPTSKLTESQVAEIRKRHFGSKDSEPLAREFGVCRQTIDSIIKGRKWRHSLEVQQ